MKIKAKSSRFPIYNESLYRSKNALEKSIKVKRETNVISKADYQNKIKSNSGDDLTFDSEMSLNETDLVIFVQISSATEILYDKDCNEYPQIYNTRNKRPIIGSIIVDDDLYSKIDKSDEEKYRIEFFNSNFLHQFTHLLGFTRSVFKDQIQNTTVKRINDVKKEMISTSNLMNFAKKYFNCCDDNDFKGIELEEKKVQSRYDEFIHWDPKIILGDYMNDFLYVQDQVISEFTLALLKDKGFYDVNYYTEG